MGGRVEWCPWGEGLRVWAQASGLSLNYLILDKENIISLLNQIKTQKTDSRKCSVNEHNVISRGP